MNGEPELAKMGPDLQDRPLRARTEGLDESFVRELASYTGEPIVTYLDVDGRSRQVWADCLAALEAVCRAARRMAEEVAPDQTAAVEEDLKAIGAWVHDGVDRSYARGWRSFPVPVGDSCLASRCRVR
jgi:hypothetical protein